MLEDISKVELAFKINNQIYKIEFKTLLHKNIYYINVKNIWFLNLALKNNLKIEIVSQVEMSFVSLKNDKHDMY